VVNVSGHRLSTAEVESAIVSHRRVAGAAVIGQSDEDSGQAICAFVTLEGDDGESSDELVAEIRDQVADRIGKFARLGDVTTLRDPDVMKQLEGKIQEEQKAEER
jgi:acetyl-CoA synthetase